MYIQRESVQNRHHGIMLRVTENTHFYKHLNGVSIERSQILPTFIMFVSNW